MINATGEPAEFTLVWSQRGWSNTTPGKLMQAVPREQHGGPFVSRRCPFKQREPSQAHGGAPAVVGMHDSGDFGMRVLSDQMRYDPCEMGDNSQRPRRDLPDPAMAALMDVFDCDAIANAGLSWRTVSRMLDRAQTLTCQPVLN